MKIKKIAKRISVTTIEMVKTLLLSVSWLFWYFTTLNLNEENNTITIVIVR
jgi:hypothetical protein